MADTEGSPPEEAEATAPTMRRLDLSEYNVNLLNPDAGKENEDKTVEPDTYDVPYHTRRSLVEILLSKQLELSALLLLENDEIARKIMHAADGFVLLTEEEYEKLANAIKTVRGLGRPDVGLIRRVLHETEKVEVEVKT